MKNLKCRHSFKECSDFYEIVLTVTYNRLNRLTAQTSSDGYNTAYTYNLNSSPRTIMRCGLTSDGTVGTVDDLALAYNGNRLAAVTDYADPVTLENSLDFPSDYAWFGYNADGNLNKDISRDITGISYSPRGMPLAIDIFGDDRFEYNYDALNCKLAENYRGRYPTTSRYYVGSLEFIKEPTDTAPRLVRANLPWGYLDADGRAYAYITDYQGNIRAVVDVQTTDYYPYGIPMATSTGATANRYKYSGKELETSGGLCQYDFSARHYRAALPLFNRPDDKAGKAPHLNPYLYCAANPLRYVDPTGEDIWKINTLGEVVAHEVTDEFDRFDFVDDDGNTIVNDDGEEQSISMEYGTVIRYSKREYGAYKKIEAGTADIFEIRGDDISEKVYEMFATNVTGTTMNEVSLIKTGYEGDRGHNFISSGHQRGSEPGLSRLYITQLVNGYNIREIIHSHPLSNYASQPDIKFKNQVIRYCIGLGVRIPLFKIFYVPLQQYIEF